LTDSRNVVAVVGGGISGLATCYYLQKFAKNKETEITLIESEERLGGKILTEKTEHLVVEAGPDSFFTQKPFALDLCKELGLTNDLVYADQSTRGTFILNKGKLSKLPEGTEMGMPTKMLPFLTTDLISTYAKIRAFMDIFIPRRKTIGGSDESVGSFIGRRFGREFLEKIVEPLYAGIFAGDVYQLSAEAIIPRLLEMENKERSLILGMRRARKHTNSKGGRSNPTFITLKEGMGQLVKTIRDNMNAVRVLSSTKVMAVKHDDTGYELSFSDSRKMRADIVVLATPSWIASEMIKELDDGISSLLDTIPFVSTATVSIAFKKDRIKETPVGHGYLVPRTEKELITGCTWESSKWPGHAPQEVLLARCYLGWFGHEEFAQMDDDSLIQKTRDFIHRTVNIDSEPIYSKVYRWNKALPQYTTGHVERMSRLDNLVKRHDGLYITGSSYKGVGLPDCIREGYLIAQDIAH
jgi:oxygen-dependent protoporphyrinogen oxidase